MPGKAHFLQELKTYENNYKIGLKMGHSDISFISIFVHLTMQRNR